VERDLPTLGFLLHEVARLLRKRFEQVARDFGLTRSQWQALSYLARNEGINQSGGWSPVDWSNDIEIRRTGGSGSSGLRRPRG